ncbi:hypothetical protein [Nocardiopsis listeri]|uniref:hypothetical protein n=1 Tax=Nocardiopsis listeri TaxID=53440 RepID=UPI000832E6AB|nr:hypothetical protein [Nocardiopsis listeri]
MASSTGHTAPVGKDIYWRRRAFVLIGVLLLFALIAYACSPSESENTSDSNQAGVEEPSPSPSEPEEEPSEEASEEPEEDASPSPSDEPSAGEDEGEDEGSGEDSSGGDSTEAAAPEKPEDPCRPQDVVVSFDFAEADREAYGADTDPGFKVSVVNVGEQTCTVDVGPEALELIVHSGEDRIYSTADCVEGKATQERQLEQGRPHDYTITWERDRSFTDCRSTSSRAQAGWYKANLRGDIVSGVDQLVFQLKA